MLLPDFIGIGAPRCGTRWLAHCFTEHPEISMPPTEVYFFTNRRIVHSYWDLGLQWYSDVFVKCNIPGASVRGEITPIYLFDDDTPALMHKCIPETKLICCLREQADRAHSWYRLFLKTNPELFYTNFSFKKFLTYHTDVYGREGFYLEHLKKFLSLYSRESILIMLYDDLVTDPYDYIRKAFRFLNVDPSFIPKSIEKRINPMNIEKKKSCFLNEVVLMMSKYKKLKKLKKIIDKYNTDILDVSELPERHQMCTEMRGRIAMLYKEHNKELGEFLGRDLKHWNIKK